MNSPHQPGCFPSSSRRAGRFSQTSANSLSISLRRTGFLLYGRNCAAKYKTTKEVLQHGAAQFCPPYSNNVLTLPLVRKQRSMEVWSQVANWEENITDELNLICVLWLCCAWSTRRLNVEIKGFVIVIFLPLLPIREITIFQTQTSPSALVDANEEVYWWCGESWQT